MRFGRIVLFNISSTQKYFLLQVTFSKGRPVKKNQKGASASDGSASGSNQSRKDTSQLGPIGAKIFVKQWTKNIKVS